MGAVIEGAEGASPGETGALGESTEERPIACPGIRSSKAEVGGTTPVVGGAAGLGVGNTVTGSGATLGIEAGLLLQRSVATGGAHAQPVFLEERNEDGEASGEVGMEEFPVHG